MTEDIHLLLGSYVLGGLSAEDRRAFDEHLRTCARCRAELAEAAPLPALLRKVSAVPVLPTASVGLEPSLARLLAAERARRKRQHTARWLATAAAALIAFGGGAATVAVTQNQGDDHRAPSVIAVPANRAPIIKTVVLTISSGQGGSGKVGLTKKAWGTSLWLQLTDMPRTGTFTLWATDDAGHTELAATWGATPSGRCSLDGATSIATDHLSQVSVVGPDESVVAVAPV